MIRKSNFGTISQKNVLTKDLDINFTFISKPNSIVRQLGWKKCIVFLIRNWALIKRNERKYTGTEKTAPHKKEVQRKIRKNTSI